MIPIDTPYFGPWVCDECGNTSPDEHAPCDCDDECDGHIDQIRALRVSQKSLTTQLAEARKEVEMLRKVCHDAAEILVLNGLTATANALIDSVGYAARLRTEAGGVK